MFAISGVSSYFLVCLFTITSTLPSRFPPEGKGERREGEGDGWSYVCFDLRLVGPTNHEAPPPILTCQHIIFEYPLYLARSVFDNVKTAVDSKDGNAVFVAEAGTIWFIMCKLWGVQFVFVSSRNSSCSDVLLY